MKLFEKLIIIITIITGCAAAVIIFTLALGSGATATERTLSPYKAPKETEGIVTAVSGEVFFFRQGGWKPVQVGELITTDDFIKTFEKSSCEIQIDDRVLVLLVENTVIQIRELLQAAGLVHSECELLVGSILCKAEKLTGEEKVTVRSGAKVFSVRGTEFLITREEGEITCAVKDGRVAVMKADNGAQESLVLPGQEILIDEKTGNAGSPAGLAAARKALLEKLAATKYVSLAKEEEQKLVKIAVEVEPAGTEINIDGKLAGYGSFAGIYPAGTQLPITLRKAGYKDETFTITVKQGDNRIYMFKLELDAPEKGISIEKKSDENTLRIEKLETDVKALYSEREALKLQNEKLVGDLEDANRKIKSALDQLQ
jgi:hypothetical protein